MIRFKTSEEKHVNGVVRRLNALYDGRPVIAKIQRHRSSSLNDISSKSQVAFSFIPLADERLR